MKTLPVTPVETLAISLRATTENRNPGIVPPWLQGRPVQPTYPVGPTIPVDDDTPRILGGRPTGFDPTPVER